MAKILTIFTPTYNRCNTLIYLYESLCKQTRKYFSWIIVDDGSVDNTSELINTWIHDDIINIEYYRTDNYGKPHATNLSLDKCESKLWMCVDSDDYLADNAVDLIINAYNIIKNDNSCGGIIANLHSFNGNVLGNKELPKKSDFINDSDIRYKFNINVDLLRIFKTSVIQKYRYPIIQGEKFIGESYLYEKINAKYYIIRDRLYFAEYRSDGLTANCLRLHVNNPRGYKILKEQVMVTPKGLIWKIKGAILYIAACKLCGDKKIIQNSQNKTLVFCVYPIGIFAYCVRYKRIKDKK
ncbi:MAG: glycosyltransferase family A protein [Eubacteriales bacterium]